MLVASHARDDPTYTVGPPITSTTNIPNLSTSAKSSQKWFKTPSKSSNPSKWPVALPYIDFGKPAPVNGQMPRTKLSYEVRNPKS
jgi:hypothetical protein